MDSSGSSFLKTCLHALYVLAGDTTAGTRVAAHINEIFERPLEQLGNQLTGVFKTLKPHGLKITVLRNFSIRTSFESFKVRFTCVLTVK